MLIFLTLIEASIAFMISRVEEAYAPYSLGISLAIYGSAFLLIWPWQYTAALVGLTWLAVAVAIAAAPDPLPAPGDRHDRLLPRHRLARRLPRPVLPAGERLVNEFRNRIELEREHERNEELRRKLERLSREDPLTGLANRRCWDETLAREFERSRRQDGSLAVILCDLDRLKDVNDRFGHAVGDQVLKATADLLRERVRASDLAARLGGRRVRRALPGHRPRRARAVARRGAEARLAELSDVGRRPPRADRLDRRGRARARRHLAAPT